MLMQHCSTYDAQVSEWLWSQAGSGPAPAMTVPLSLQATLRYGESCNNDVNSDVLKTQHAIRRACSSRLHYQVDGFDGMPTDAVHV
jgi:AICAR transformylase/IMP cyclohydrolase PurH